jgi:acyl-CoA reductase-like NAD-dependent aldehyde dehydrogenase
MISRYFSRRQLAGLQKTGDALLPGTRQSPSFSQTGCGQHIDRMAAFMGPEDLDGLRLVLGIFAWLPKWVIRLIMECCRLSPYLPGPAGKSLRLLELGVKGAIVTPYYSGVSDAGYQGTPVHEVIGWDARLETPEGEPEAVRPAADDFNPSRQDPDEADVAAIYRLARRGAGDLRRWDVRQRLEFIRSLRLRILERREEILDRIQQDTRKSRTDALTSEIFGTLDHLHYLEKNAGRILADRKVPTPLALMGKRSQIVFEPMGVVLIICPWNYPFYQAIVPITTAFTVGNAVIFKPSEETPLQGLVESLLADCGFHPDWVQVVYGVGDRVGPLLIDRQPDKIFFIGSQKTGRAIMTRAAGHLIPVELEMGGKDPMIVFEDADLQRAASGAVWGAFTNSGQSCTSVERLYVHEAVYDPFKGLLVEMAQRLRVATDTDGSADMGPITTPRQVAVIARQVADAREKGARFLTGGQWDGQSAAVPAMVVENTTDEMLINREESFGPLLPLFRFANEAEAITRANASTFGLAASVWTADARRADRVARALVTGNVSINNVMLTEGNHALPFGGARKSGIGRYKGEFGLTGFANIKSVLTDKNSAKQEANWFPYSPRKLALFDRLTAGLYAATVSGLVKGLIHGLILETHVGRQKRRLPKIKRS